jgi:hypothetical protein
MTNHPNRSTVYRVQIVNGRFDHVATRRAAVIRAAEMVGAPEGTTASELELDWGVTITRIRAAVARSIGL